MRMHFLLRSQAYIVGRGVGESTTDREDQSITANKYALQRSPGSVDTYFVTPPLLSSPLEKDEKLGVYRIAIHLSLVTFFTLPF